MKKATAVALCTLSLSLEIPSYGQELPTLSGKIGLEHADVPESSASAYDRVYAKAALDGTIPFRVGRSQREIIYGLGFRGWVTRSTPPLDPEQITPGKNIVAEAQTESEFALEKAILEYNRRRWKFRIGQQELALGEVLGPSVIDLANARDYRQADQFLKSTDRISQLMALMEYKRRRFGFQLFVSPLPEAMKLPKALGDLPIQSQEMVKDPEYGFRYNYLWKGLELKFYALHHQNRNPILVPELTDAGLSLLALQRYEDSFANTFSYAWDYIVLRGELIRTLAKKLDPLDLTPDQTDQAVLALDYTSESQLLLVGQLQSIAPYHCTALPGCSEHQVWGGAQLQKPLFDDLFLVNAFLYRRLDQNTVFQKFDLTWNMTETLQVKGSYESYDGFVKDGLAFLDVQDRYLVDANIVF